MAQATWEKPSAAAPAVPTSGGRLKFLIGGVLILAAVVYLIVTGTIAGASYFITVEDLLNNPTYAGQTVRISGAVIGDTIQYDSETLLIEFTVAHLPLDTGDAGKALHEAVNDPNATRLAVRVENTVKPELLQNEAQAIMAGRLGDDGVFHVTKLLLKCPSRYIEGGPAQESIAPMLEEQVEVGAGA